MHLYLTYICFPKYILLKHAFISKKYSGTWQERFWNNDKKDINSLIMAITSGAKIIKTGWREWVQFSIQQRQVNIDDEKVDLMDQGTK